MEPEELDRRQQSFDALFESHYDSVVRYCLRRLGPADAEDAAAEVFAVAWRRMDQVPPPEAERAWLLGVAYRVVGNQFRGRRRRVRLVDRLESTSFGAADSSTAGDFRLLHLALEALRPADRELLRLAAWDGLTRLEIAAVMGIEVNAVDQRLFRARARMRDRLERLREDARRMGAQEAST
jgi:RNA polymerase sigma-70 factor (ECF subfamily)